MPSATPLARDHFPVTRRWTYLDHAGIAPLPRPAVDAMHACNLRVAEDGSTAFHELEDRVDQVRATAARLLGVPAGDVAFVKNTTEGLGFVANGLELKAGDRVVVPDREFPSTIYPWLALADRGVRVDRVHPAGDGWALPVDAFAQAVAAGPPPRVVVTSWVQFGRGWRTDLAALAQLCRDAGALLCVDVIQGLGVIPAELERWGVDFAMADAHKWLLGPEGIGVLYVRGERLEGLRPLEPGWNSVGHRMEWDNLDLVYDTGARRLEGGTHNIAGITGMGVSMDLLLDATVQAVWRHVDQLCERAAEGLAAAGATVLSDRSAEGRSGILVFIVPGQDLKTVAATLRKAGIACVPRGGGIRISPHGYTTPEEIDHLVETVKRLPSTRRAG